MRWTKLSVVLLGAAAVGCASPELSPQQRNVEGEAVLGRLSRWTTALNNKELDSLKATYRASPRVAAIWPGGVQVVGAENQATAIDNFYGQIAYMNFVPQSPEVDVLAPNVAVTRFRHSLDMRYHDTRREVSSGHTTLVWVKSRDDGVWRIHRQHIGTNPPM